MSRNKVQFQKSMSIHSFIEKFGSEQQCREHLFALRWPNGFHCPYCGHDQYCQLKSRALYQCNQCHHQSSLVAGTLFEGTKLPLRLWFLAIYLITQEKNGIWGLGSNGTKNQRKKNIRTFHRIALKSSGTETYASKRHHSEWMYCPIGLRLDFVAVEALLLQLLPVQQMNIFLTY